MMENDEKIISEYNWIPWQRYLLLLEIDNKKTMDLGRFRRSEKLSRKAAWLSKYKGYEVSIIDTRTQEKIGFGCQVSGPETYMT